MNLISRSGSRLCPLSTCVALSLAQAGGMDDSWAGGRRQLETSFSLSGAGIKLKIL